MEIVEVTAAEDVAVAGRIHAASWQESHRAFCNEAFVALHTPERQTSYLLEEMRQGKRLFMAFDPEAVGIVTVWESLIENLYVLPEKQCMGYGTALLRLATAQCTQEPTLWILDNNQAALALYSRHGFVLTGRRNRLTDSLYELEMKKRPVAASISERR